MYTGKYKGMGDLDLSNVATYFGWQQIAAPLGASVDLKNTLPGGQVAITFPSSNIFNSGSVVDQVKGFTAKNKTLVYGGVALLATLAILKSLRG